MNRGHLVILGVALAAVLLLVQRMRGGEVEEKSHRKNTGKESVSIDDKIEPDACENALCVTLGGSIAIGRGFGDSPVQKRGYETFFENYKEFLKSSDLVVAGLLSPLTDAPPPIKEQNVAALSLANSHIYSNGLEALGKTTDILDKHNIAWFGAAKGDQDPKAPFRFEKDIQGKTFKLAVFGLTQKSPNPLSQTDDEESWSFSRFGDAGLEDRIRSLKDEEPDVFVIVYPFWGREYRRFTKQDQVIIEPLALAGADLVVGYGTRMIGDLKWYQGKWLVYSVGDFVFNSKGNYEKYKRTLPMSTFVRLVVRNVEGKLQVEQRLYPIYTNNQDTDYKGRFLTIKELGSFYWSLLDKYRLGYDIDQKKKLYPRQDIHGRYIKMETEIE